VSGKFDLPTASQQEPYAAVKHAIAEICQHIFDLPRRRPEEDQKEVPSEDGPRPLLFEDVKERILAKLASDLETLFTVVPNLIMITGMPASLPVRGDRPAKRDYKETAGRLRFAYRRFIQVVVAFAPLVFMMDAIHWADLASSNLLENWLTDNTGNGCLLVLACYRSNEVSPALRQTMESIDRLNKQDSTCQMSAMEVNELTCEHVRELLADVLNTTSDETRPLAQLVHQRTRGKAYFVVQCLLSISDLGLLSYSLGASRWTWDLESIRGTNPTDNVADLLRDKLKENETVKSILPVAACLGATFDYTILQAVMMDLNKSQESIDKSLKSCREGGFVEIVNEKARTYRFVHDKVQEAALGLTDDTELQALKSRVGNILLDKFADTEEDRLVFTTVSLVNPRDIPESKRNQVMELNLLAVKKAMECSAFASASKYLGKAIELLPQNHWKTHYRLSVDVFSFAASTEFSQAHFDQMKVYCSKVIRMCCTPGQGVGVSCSDKWVLGRRRYYACQRSGVDYSQSARCKFPKEGLWYGVWWDG
jgi:predicted ATPase